MKSQGYPAEEKLKKKKEIDLLFAKGKWMSLDSIRIIILKSSEKYPIESHKIGVSVSKRYFKKAVDRNRIKRLLREAYRLNKEAYFETFGEKNFAMLFWVSKEKPNHYKIVEEQFLKLCKK